MTSPVPLLLGLLASPVLVDMVVASVDGRPITFSELVAETKLVLLRTRGVEIAEKAALTQPLLNAVLMSIVHRELLLAEVRRLQLREVPEAEVERAFKERFEARFSRPAQLYPFLERAGFPAEAGRSVPPLVAAIVRGDLEAERFLDVRIRLGLKLDPAKVEECYRANLSVFKGRAFEEVEGRIRERLLAELEEAGLRQLLRQLKARATLTFAPGYEPPPPELGPSPVGFRCLAPELEPGP